MAFQILYQDDAFVFANQGRLCVTYARAELTVAHVDRGGRLEADIIARVGPISVVNVLGDTGRRTPVSEEVKQAMREWGEKLGSQITGYGWALQAKGLTGIFLSTFLAKLLLASKAKFPLRAFGDIAEAVRWLQQLPGQPSDLAADASLPTAVVDFVRPLVVPARPLENGEPQV